MSTYGELTGIPIKQIWPGITARLVHSELITMALVELAPNSVVAEHRHMNEQVGFLIEGSLRFTVDGESRDCGPGSTWRILSDLPHSAVAGPDGAVVAEVYSPIRADWAALPDHDPQQPVWPQE